MLTCCSRNMRCTSWTWNHRKNHDFDPYALYKKLVDKASSSERHNFSLFFFLITERKEAISKYVPSSCMTHLSLHDNSTLEIYTYEGPKTLVRTYSTLNSSMCVFWKCRYLPKQTSFLFGEAIAVGFKKTSLFYSSKHMEFHGKSDRLRWQETSISWAQTNLPGSEAGVDSAMNEIHDKYWLDFAWFHCFSKKTFARNCTSGRPAPGPVP